MRDTLKPKEYFDKKKKKMSEGIQKFENGLAEGKYQADKILFIKDYILQKKIGIIIAKYSKGDPLNDIKQEFDSAVELFCEAWDDSVYDSNIIYEFGSDVLFNHIVGCCFVNDSSNNLVSGSEWN